jgi:hypothetical protein
MTDPKPNLTRMLPGRWIPALAGCQADHDNGTDWGRCGKPAVAVVYVYEVGERYVCQDHLGRI